LIGKDYADLQLEIQKADVLVVATGAQNPTVDAAILNLKKPLLILDLSIPKNVNENVRNQPNVTLIHLDDLSQITDETLENRKSQVPAAEIIINEIKQEFFDWMNNRKYAPTIHSLKAKLLQIKEKELAKQSKKIENYNEAQAEIISNKIIQNITNHFVSHLKNNETNVDESVELINKIFSTSPASS
jgi:glutamyl-tRNA reductase